MLKVNNKLNSDREAFISARNNVLCKSFVTDLWMKVIHRAIDDIVMYKLMRDEGKNLKEEDEEFEDSAYKFLFDDNYRIPIDDYLIDITCPKCREISQHKRMSDLSKNSIICSHCQSRFDLSSTLYSVSNKTVVKDVNLRELLSIWNVNDISGFRDGVIEKIETLVEKKKASKKKGKRKLKELSEETKKEILFCTGIQNTLAKISDMLIEKNKKYGNSATDPLRVFSKADTKEQIRVRIDDKISRMVRGDKTNEDEDVRLDLIGYLVILEALESGEIK